MLVSLCAVVRIAERKVETSMKSSVADQRKVVSLVSRSDSRHSTVSFTFLQVAARPARSTRKCSSFNRQSSWSRADPSTTHPRLDFTQPLALDAAGLRLRKASMIQLGAALRTSCSSFQADVELIHPSIQRYRIHQRRSPDPGCLQPQSSLVIHDGVR